MTTLTVDATLQPDGTTLRLEKKLPLPPGRVTVSGPGAREVASALLPLLQDQVEYVCREAAQALSQVDPDTATKHGLP